MKVAILSFSFPDYTIRLANAVSERVEKVTLLLPKERAIRQLSAIHKEIDLYLFGEGALTRRNFSYLLGFYRALGHLQRFKPDVVHVQGGFAEWFVLAVPFLRKYTLVTTFHDVKLHPGEDTFLPRFYCWCGRRLSKEIIVHGEKLKEQMVTEFNVPGHKVHVIQIGEHEVAPFKQYEREDLKEDGNLILFFGRIYEYKGLEYLIKAEPMITKEVPDARIVIAGKGENFQKYEKMMTNRDKFIVYNDYISYQKGAELFQRCSVVVLPYIDASQSGVVPPAYGFKKPVVVTNVGSIPEIVDEGKTGFIVPPRNSEALAEAVIRLLKDEKLRREMGENGYRKLQEDMSWDKIAEKTIAVYEKALQVHKRIQQ